MFNLGEGPEPKKQLDGNMLPVINMTFLLLLFFIVVGSFSEAFNQDISPPQSSSEALNEDSAKELSLSADGELWWQGEKTTLLNWASRLQAEGQSVPTRVRLRADGTTPAAVIIPLIDELKLLNVKKVALVTVNDLGML